MKFHETSIPGCFVIDLTPQSDERGFFSRTFCQREFASRGLASSFVQCGISFNPRCGTLRGMHYQIAPHAECKLIRCTRGAIYDVALDLRQDAPTFGRWCAQELTADNRRMIYIPEGVAHGFQTLTDDAEVFYQMSAAYHPDSARGVRYDDPAFGISWPLPVTVISERDRSYPDLQT